MRSWPPSAPVAVVLAVLVLASPRAVRAQSDAGTASSGPAAGAADAGVDGASDAGAPESPEAAALRAGAARVRELVAGTLDVGVAPATLFDISLDDEETVRVEAERLRAIVERADRPPAAEPAPPEPVRPRSKRSAPADAGPADAGPADAGPADAGALAELDPRLFAARVELDRARLEFYMLPAARREAILAEHAGRQRQDAAARATAGLGEAERRVRQAEAERQRAVAAAEHARTEAERIVAEEHARLLGIARAQAEIEADVARARQALEQRAEKSLGFHRRVRQLLQSGSATSAGDDLYLELRAFLRASRDELASAISAVSAPSDVPHPGDERLTGLSVNVDRSAVDASRGKLEAAAQQLEGTERELREARARQLYGEVMALNNDRLALLPHLSTTSRDAITGFGSAGRDQAGTEVRQVMLILAYHLVAARDWLADVGDSGSRRGSSAMGAGLVVLKWALAVALFIWWRRRAAGVLGRWRGRVREADRRAREVTRSPLDRVLGFVLRIRRPLEWLGFVWLLTWLLPPAAANMLEVRLVTTIVRWTFGGALAVSVIDALAGGGSALEGRDGGRTAEVRLRSLQLIGRTIVVFGLILALSSQLVGKGTIYGWVLSTCWFAVIPVGLLVVRWWRAIIFERIDAVRRKRAFETWIVAHRSGWKSFPAAVAAGAYLFVQGGMRIVRGRVSRFDLTRRALAYIFRRGLDRIAEEKSSLAFAALPKPLFTALGPETPSADAVQGVSNAECSAIIERLGSLRGGVFAVVGERGGGKTTALGRVRDSRPGAILLDCTHLGLEGLRNDLTTAVDMPRDATVERCAELLDASDGSPALLIDDAHLLIQPVLGGLADFDSLIDVARQNSASCTWVFAVDQVIWRFFERARGARPLFDDVVELDPWREEGIARLIQARTEQATIEPVFDHLLEKLPADADDVNLAEAVARTATGYYRLLWDYSDGNPGVALHMWRQSLGIGPEGEVCVRLFQSPDARQLDGLPDPAVFVLRAVIQLEPATPVNVEAATMLRSAQVEDALRYGLARGYFERNGDRYRVTWTWFRPITRFLERRHLRVSR